MSGFVVVVKVVVVTVVVGVVTVAVAFVVVDENTGKIVSVMLTSGKEVVSTVVETDAGSSFHSIVVTKSILSSLALSCIVVTTATVVVAPATTRNIKMPLMSITTFLTSPETS